MEEDRKLLRTFLNVAVPVIEVSVLIFLIPRLLMFFWPFVVAWILALITSPLVDWIEKTFHIVRRHSSMIMIILMLALVALAASGIIAVVAVQVIRFVQYLPDIYNSVVLQINRLMEEYSYIFSFLPAPFINTIQRITGDIGSAFGVLFQGLASPTFVAAQTVVVHIPSVVVYTVLTIFAAYCMIAGKEELRDYAYDNIAPYIPSGWKLCWQTLKKEWRAVIGGYFLAQLKIMTVVAAIIFVGLIILQVRFAFWWSLLIAVLDFLPIVGAGTALIPWALYQLITRNYKMAIALVILYIIICVVRQFIQPKIVSDTMGLSPIKTVVLLFLGFRLFGFVGMILSVPAGMLFFRMVDDGVFSEWTENVKKLVMLWGSRDKDRDKDEESGENDSSPERRSRS